MKRHDLEHIIRVAASISGDDEIVVIGSQAILGQFPEASGALTVSMEANVFPKNHPERWDLIDGSIGEGSPFHEMFQYYAQGVGPETATLPDGWQQRLIPVQSPNTRGAIGWCLEVHDLVISKYIANRPKDEAFIKDVARYGLAQAKILRQRLQATPVADEAVRRSISSRIARDFAH